MPPYHLPPTSYLLPPTTYHLPPTSYHLPPTSYHLPPTTYLLPPATYHLPPTTCHLPPTTYRLPPAAYHLPPTAYRLPPTTYRSLYAPPPWMVCSFVADKDKCDGETMKSLLVAATAGRRLVDRRVYVDYGAGGSKGGVGGGAGVAERAAAKEGALTAVALTSRRPHEPRLSGRRGRVVNYDEQQGKCRVSLDFGDGQRRTSIVCPTHLRVRPTRLQRSTEGSAGVESAPASPSASPPLAEQSPSPARSSQLTAALPLPNSPLLTDDEPDRWWHWVVRASGEGRG